MHLYLWKNSVMKPWLDVVTFHSHKLYLFQVFVLLSLCTSSLAEYFPKLLFQGNQNACSAPVSVFTNMAVIYATL